MILVGVIAAASAVSRLSLLTLHTLVTVYSYCPSIYQMMHIKYTLLSLTHYA